MIVFNLPDRAVHRFNIPELHRVDLLVIIQRLLAQPEKFIGIKTDAEFFMGKLRMMKNILHPEIIFECRYFPEMKMIKKWKVLAEIVHRSLPEAGHVFYIL